jgi:DNA topoisomerase-1
LTAAQALDDLPPATSKTAGNKVIVEAVDAVAETLGNTRAVCRKCYIHPAVLDAYMSGVTLSQVEPVRAKAMRGLLDAEARLVSLLLRMDRRAKAA